MKLNFNSSDLLYELEDMEKIWHALVQLLGTTVHTYNFLQMVFFLRMASTGSRWWQPPGFFEDDDISIDGSEINAFKLLDDLRARNLILQTGGLGLTLSSMRWSTRMNYAGVYCNVIRSSSSLPPVSL